MRSLVKIISLGVGLLATLRPGAAENPNVGLLYNQVESGSLSYVCRKRADVLECEFVQVSVRPEAKPSDWEKRVAEVLAGFDSMKADVEKNGCEQILEYLS